MNFSTRLEQVLYSETGLSFWGGVSPSSGVVVDRHHPLHGLSLRGKILAIPAGRGQLPGSCTGSQVILELLLNTSNSPAAIVLSQADEIIALGAIVAEELFDKKLPVICLEEADFQAMSSWRTATINGSTLWRDTVSTGSITAEEQEDIQLSASDQKMLEGSEGFACRKALSIVVRMARLQGADTLIDVKQAYLKMGAKGSFTCAPYLLHSAPEKGDHIGWGESNAVVFANSVLGARTQKYADFLDACVAITGRAPLAGCHVERAAQVVLQVKMDVSCVAAVVYIAAMSEWRPAVSSCIDDAFYPTLGYLCGLKAPRLIPAILGLDGLQPTRDDLKAQVHVCSK
eukprot:Skav229255  [mRNA]  locus=scaffold2418:44184:48482:- [translate_table: standard]